MTLNYYKDLQIDNWLFQGLSVPSALFLGTYESPEY